MIKEIEKLVSERGEQYISLPKYFAEILGKLHNKHKLFSLDIFNNTHEENNIIYALNDFNYLQIFYKEYQKQFDNTISNLPNLSQARSCDLPFLGKQVLEKGEVDFIFYFEGSLSSVDRLSITVLAHLWSTEDDNIIDKFCGKNKWWTKFNFENIKSKLNIPSDVIARSYITDAVRFEDGKASKNLIQEEIELFKPKLVICVGSKARELVGMRYYDFPTKFHYVRFPKYHNETKMYEYLNKILSYHLTKITNQN